MLDNQDELFIVVDEQDNVLDYRSRYECHHDSSLIHRTVSIVLSDKIGNIVLQKRSMNKDTEPGKYTVSASGHVEKGQSYQEAAERELLEEIGVKTPLQFIKKLIVRTKKESEMATVFTGTYSGIFHPAADEVDMVKYYTKEDINKMQNLLTTTAKRVFEALQIL